MRRASKGASKFADSTLAFTESSFAYKDPFNPHRTILGRGISRVRTFIASRSIENEFVDYASYRIPEQFKDVYLDLFNAYKRNDKVIMKRSLSETMYDVSIDSSCLTVIFAQHIFNLAREKRPNPFYRDINSIKFMQARIYANSDYLLPEDQWAQLTLKYNLVDLNGNKLTQYNVFERRLADKLSYYDWKLCLQGDQEEFELMHKPSL